MFNTDQGIASEVFASELNSRGVEISMEHLWRIVKYGNISLIDYKDLKELKEGVKYNFEFFDNEMHHDSLGYAIPDVVCCFSRGSRQRGLMRRISVMDQKSLSDLI